MLPAAKDISCSKLGQLMTLVWGHFPTTKLGSGHGDGRIIVDVTWISLGLISIVAGDDVDYRVKLLIVCMSVWVYKGRETKRRFHVGVSRSIRIPLSRYERLVMHAVIPVTADVLAKQMAWASADMFFTYPSYFVISRFTNRVNSLWPDGTKPLPEPLLTFYQ